MSMKIVYTFRARQDLKEINVPEEGVKFSVSMGKNLL